MSENTLDPWQYRISGTFHPDALRVGQMYLQVGPDLGVIQVSDQTGHPVGVLLGFPIDLDGGTYLGASDNHRVAFDLGADLDDFVDKVIASLAGRFLFILNTGSVLRIYPDCVAQVPCVYDPVLKIAASTSHAMLDESAYWERFDQAMYDRLDVAREGWFPGGLTAHTGISRVLPNHYLDLQDWGLTRCWPREELVTAPNPMKAVDELVALVRTQLTALSAGPLEIAQGLTAGRETRTLQACARPVVSQIQFVTITGADRHACDTVMARKIAGDQGLRHREIPRVTATQAQRDLFVRRGGHCVGDSNALYHPSVWPLAKNYILAGGIGGEVGRGFFWKPADTPDTDLSGASLVGRLGLARQDQIIAGLDAWLKGLPTDNALEILDFAYVEQRMAPWSGAQFCCDPTLIRTAPLMTRRGVDLLLSLPPEWKRTNRLFAEIIKANWPELEKYPYNSLGFWSDTFNKAVRAIENPNIILKKLRKLAS